MSWKEFSTVFSKLLDRYGLPTIALSILLYAIALVADWASPRIDLLIRKHSEFIESIDQSQDEISKTLEATNRVFDRMEKHVARTGSQVEEIHRSVVPPRHAHAQVVP